MMKKKSVKKNIKTGNIIHPKGNDYYYKVVELKDRVFECELITHDTDWMGYKQDFLYSIEMEVFSVIDSNF